jgi:short-subunit dehydrogenase
LKLIWIIGASNGIGFELVKLYLAKNSIVIASARDAQNNSELCSLQEEYPNNLFLINMDVTSTISVNTATKSAWSIYGYIDICIYNAGIYESMSLDNWNLSHFEEMNQVNYMGAVRVLDQIVPKFIRRKKGHIAFNISISSYFGLPYGGGYSAPKAALLNLCESIYPELEKENIKLQVINHGFVKTRLTQKNNFKMPQLLEPQEAANKIYEGIENLNKFEIKFPWALTKFIGVLRLIPYKLSFHFTKKAL